MPCEKIKSRSDIVALNLEGSPSIFARIYAGIRTKQSSEAKSLNLTADGGNLAPLFILYTLILAVLWSKISSFHQSLRCPGSATSKLCVLPMEVVTMRSQFNLTAASKGNGGGVKTLNPKS